MENKFNSFFNEDLHKNIQNIIKNAEHAESSENKSKWSLGDTSVTIGTTKDGAYYLHYKIDNVLVKQTIEDFKKYLEVLDDDVFMLACKLYEAKFGEHSLEQLNENVENPSSKIYSFIENFKQIVKDAIKIKIENLTKAYLS